MRHKILLIEDNEGDIFLIREALREANFQGDITEIRDGEAAIAYLSAKKREPNTINLVLLDVNLPKKNGFEVLRFIKEDRALRHIPVVMLTTSSSREHVRAAYRDAANSYVTKPSSSEDFQEVIARIQNYWFSIAQLSD